MAFITRDNARIPSKGCNYAMRPHYFPDTLGTATLSTTHKALWQTLVQRTDALT